MSLWALPILLLALIAALAAWNIPRAALWVGLAMTSFVASSLWWGYGSREAHTLFTFTCDALLVLAIFNAAEERWEAIVCGAYLISVFTSLLRLAGGIPVDWIYAVALETSNYIALLCIFGVGLLDFISRRTDRAPSFVLRSLRSARHSLQ